MDKKDLIGEYAWKKRIELISGREFTDELPKFLSVPDDEINEALNEYYKYLSDKFFLFFNQGGIFGPIISGSLFGYAKEYPYLRYLGNLRPPLEAYVLAYLLSFPLIRKDNIFSTFYIYDDVFNDLKKVWENFFSNKEESMKFFKIQEETLSPYYLYPVVVEPEKQEMIANDFFRVFEDVSVFEPGTDYGIEPVVYRGGVPHLNRERADLPESQKALTRIVRHALDRILLFNYNTFGPYYYSGGRIGFFYAGMPTLWYYLARRNEFLDMFETALLVPYEGDLYPQYKGKKTYLEVLYIFTRDILYLIDFNLIFYLRLLEEGVNMDPTHVFRDGLIPIFEKNQPYMVKKKEEILGMQAFSKFVDVKSVFYNLIDIGRFLTRYLYPARNFYYYLTRFTEEIEKESRPDILTGKYGFLKVTSQLNVDPAGYVCNRELETAEPIDKPVEGCFLCREPGSLAPEIIMIDTMYTEVGKYSGPVKTGVEYQILMLDRSWLDEYLENLAVFMAVTPFMHGFTWTQSFFGRYTWEEFEEEVKNGYFYDLDLNPVPETFDYEATIKNAENYAKNTWLLKNEAKYITMEILKDLYQYEDQLNLSFRKNYLDEFHLFFVEDHLSYWRYI